MTQGPSTALGMTIFCAYLYFALIVILRLSLPLNLHKGNYLNTPCNFADCRNLGFLA